jgi:acyl-CoA synthetase (NDP forming)
VLTNAGGLGILCADACEAAGLSLPPLADETIAALRAALPAEASLSNPVDMLGSAVGRTYEEVLPIVLKDPGIDAVIALFVPPVVAGAEEVAEAIARAVEAGSRDGKPVLACVISQDGTPQQLLSGAVAAFDYPESAARALGRAADRSEWLRREQGRVPELSDIDRDAARAVVDEAEERWLGADEIRRLLTAYGLPVVPERVANSEEEALAAAGDLGYPVVVKTAAAGVHKSEEGGVALDLRDAESVCEAVTRIGLPVLVQPLVRDGAELLVGVFQDPVFGPLVALGPGGTMAELIGDAGFRLAPLTDADAEELAESGKAGRVLKGWRGAAPADRSAVLDVLLRVARLADDLPDVAELDLNPVIAGPSGCVVVDARVRVARARRPGPLKSW